MGTAACTKTRRSSVREGISVEFPLEVGLFELVSNLRLPQFRLSAMPGRFPLRVEAKELFALTKRERQSCKPKHLRLLWDGSTKYSGKWPGFAIRVRIRLISILCRIDLTIDLTFFWVVKLQAKETKPARPPLCRAPAAHLYVHPYVFVQPLCADTHPPLCTPLRALCPLSLQFPSQPTAPNLYHCTAALDPLRPLLAVAAGLGFGA